MFWGMTHVPMLLTVKQVGLRLNASGDAVRAWCRADRLVIHLDADGRIVPEPTPGGETIKAIRLPSREYRIPDRIVDAIERGEFNPDARPYAYPAGNAA
jgi:hypothetical protein